MSSYSKPTLYSKEKNKIKIYILNYIEQTFHLLQNISQLKPHSLSAVKVKQNFEDEWSPAGGGLRR